MLWLIGLALVTAPSPSAPAMLGFIDAARLSELCAPAGPQARDRLPICLGYTTGAVDQILSEQALGPAQARTVCPPQGITAREVMGAIVQYAEWSNSAHGVSAAGFVRSAMEKAYPCGDDDRLTM